MIAVKWRAYNPDAYPGSMKLQTTSIPSWPYDPETVAERVADNFFANQAEWESWFGFDEDSADIRVEITAPAEVAGHYDIELRHVLKARATKAEAPR